MADSRISETSEKILKWSGFWPDSATFLDKLKAYLFLLACSLLILYPQYLFIAENLDNLAEISVSISMVFSNVLWVLKMIVFIYYRKELSELIEEMREQWEKCEFKCMISME
jgi:hypothetical protein